MHIDLHLGVHKTATTHLQRHWLACSQLPGATAVCPPLAEVRTQLTPVCSAPTVKSKTQGEDARRLSAARAWVLRLAAAGRPLLLSDENLVGSCERLFATQALYTSVLQRLQRLAPVLEGRTLRVWLSVREYGAFLRSAYCETLRHGPYRPFREAYSGFDLAGRGWEHVVRDIRQALPQAELCCWRYESMPGLRTGLTASLVGLAPAAQPAPDEQRDRRSLSRLAVRLLDDIHQRVGADEATRVRPSVERVVAGAGMPAFDPWTDTERAELSAAYDRSIAALQALPGVTWLG
ncbi:MAG: hypothetical protein U1F53_02240 [Burkholderiaceae bacterium]